MKLILVLDAKAATRYNTIAMAGMVAEAWFNSASHGENYKIEIDPFSPELGLNRPDYCVRVVGPRNSLVGYLANATGAVAIRQTLEEMGVTVEKQADGRWAVFEGGGFRFAAPSEDAAWEQAQTKLLADAR